MRKFIIKFFTFVSCFFLFYPLLIKSSDLPVLDEISKNFLELKKGGNGHMWTRLQEADTTQNIDVLILGSSLAYRGIDPRKFDEIGLRAFNLGSSAQTPLQTQYLLEKYLDQLNPKLVIWDVNPFTFSTSGHESFIDILANCSNCTDLFEMAYKINDITTYNTYLKSKLNQIFGFDEPNRRNNDNYIQGGFVEKSLVEVYNGGYVKQNILKILPMQKSCFEKVLSNFSERNIYVLLVYAPVSKKFYKNILNKDEYKKYFLSKANEGYAIRFIDFNEFLKLPDSYFFDNIHLNNTGVIIYNQELIHQLSVFFR